MRFGRRRSHDAGESAEAVAADQPEDGGSPSGTQGERARGPFDSSEVPHRDDDADESSVDLGSLVVTGRPGIELRLQVDESSGAVASALLVSQDGAVELRAFASPRNGSIWDDVRRSIAAEAARQGGTATEVDGPWGKELMVMVTAKDDQGRTVTQPSRIVGITGPRWLLRATFFGRAAEHPDPEGDLESALRDVVVVRGNQAMAPGDFLPLTLPAGAQRME